MIQSKLTCVQFIGTLYDSMEKNSWRGFDNWMCFRCGHKFTLDKYVSYDSNTLMLVFSDCNHPACSYCDRCFSIWLAPIGTTDFQQFNLLRLDYQLISFLQELGNMIVNDFDKRCNKCFIFNLLICFARAKIFKHIADMTGAFYNLSIGAICTMQGLFDNVGNWSRDDFINLARQLDGANDAADGSRIVNNILKSFN